MRLRALLIATAAGGALTGALVAAQPAEGGRIVTWDDPKASHSQFVDPSTAPPTSYNEPPGIEPRPNALRVNVYLPDGYGSERRRYPVLYLLHGQGDAYDSWVNPNQGDLLQVAAGFPGIIVMPEADRGFYTNWWNEGLRGAPGWERYHLDELIPLVEERLRIRRKRRWHAIAGLSMGGEGAVFYAAQRPGYFGSAAAFSGPLSIQRLTYQQGFNAGTGQSKEAIYGDPRGQEFYWHGHNPARLVENLRHTRVYVAAGNGVPGNPDEADNTFGIIAELELGQHAAEFVNAAQAAGVQVTYDQRQGIHDWPYWRRDLANAIQWDLFGPPPRPRGSWTYHTVAQEGTMWNLRFSFAEAPSEVETFVREGKTLSATGSGTVTICKGRHHRRCFTAALPFTRPLPARPRPRR